MFWRKWPARAVAVGRAWVAVGLLAAVMPAAVSSAQDSVAQDAEQAEWRPHVTARFSGGVGELVVNDRTVIRFRERRGKMSPAQQAQAAAIRLTRAIRAGLTPTDVRTDTTVPEQPTLIAGDEKIAALSVPAVPPKPRRTRAARAKAARESTTNQVGHWVGILRQSLALPGLTVRNSGVVVPLGEKRPILIGGPARGPVQVIAENVAAGGRKRVGVSVDAVLGGITLTGLEPGREKLTLIREGATATVYVAVRPYAAQVEAPPTVTVTGSEVPASLVSRCAVLAARGVIQPLPGASLEMEEDRISAKPLTPGRTQRVAVPIRATGPDMLPVERKVFVPVVNRSLPRVGAATLFYSNVPERVSQPETLFVGRMATDGATRLLYHHQSTASEVMLFTAELLNDGDTPTRIQVIGGDAGPVRDTVWAGYRAASDFVQAHDADLGVVLTLPAHARVPLSSLRLPPGLTISGLMQLRILSGPAPLVRVAVEDWETHKPEIAFLPEPLQGTLGYSNAISLSDHIYPNPAKKIDGEYTVGKEWAFLRFGRNPLASANDPKRLLYGNYGVFYDFAINLNNPTDQPATARLVFEPSAGMAGGVFLIENQRVEIPQIDMPEEQVLATYRLAPGETKSVRVRTLPVSGSNYPATIIIRP